MPEVVKFITSVKKETGKEKGASANRSEPVSVKQDPLKEAVLLKPGDNMQMKQTGCKCKALQKVKTYKSSGKHRLRK